MKKVQNKMLLMVLSQDLPIEANLFTTCKFRLSKIELLFTIFLNTLAHSIEVNIPKFSPLQWFVLAISAVVILYSISNTSQTSPVSSQPSEKIYGLGEEISLGELLFTVNKTKQYSELGEYYTKNTEGMFYTFDITIKNNGNHQKSIIPTHAFYIVDNKGRRYEPNNLLAAYAKTMGLNPFSSIEEIPAGLSKKGIVVFEMPKETKGKLVIQSGLFSEEKQVDFE